jgi:hypothetical protein
MYQRQSQIDWSVQSARQPDMGDHRGDERIGDDGAQYNKTRQP